MGGFALEQRSIILTDVPSNSGCTSQVERSKVCAVFVTYFPSADFFLRLQNIRFQLDGALIIVDNTPQVKYPPVLMKCGDLPHVHVKRNEANLGIARALNQGIDYARDLGYKWVMTFDQDSDIGAIFMAQMMQTYMKISDYSVHPIAVLGPNYIDQILKRPAHAVKICKAAIEVREVITSGCLVSLKAYSAVNGFNEMFFIDMVDTDYCFRVRQAGYSVWRTSEPLMEHSLGRLTPRHVFGFRFNVTNHLPQRRYYIFRNSIHMVKKYFFYDFYWCLFIIFNYLPKVFIKACLFEDRKKENLHYIILGIWDGVFSRFSRKVL